MYVITQLNQYNVTKTLVKLKDTEDPVTYVEDYLRSIHKHGVVRNTNTTWLGYITKKGYGSTFVEIRITQVNKLKN